MAHVMNAGTTAISSHQKVEIVEADMAVDHDHIRSMTVVFVTNGPMRGINLCERAVAVAVEFKLVAAPAPVMEVGNAVTRLRCRDHLRQLPPPTSSNCSPATPASVRQSRAILCQIIDHR